MVALFLAPVEHDPWPRPGGGRYEIGGSRYAGGPGGCTGRTTVALIPEQLPMSTQSSLTFLGHATGIPASPEIALLERVPNPDPDAGYLVRFACPEFTSLCPASNT